MARVYVVGGYIPAGGALMSYHVAEIAGRRFGHQVRVVRVDTEDPGHGIYRYPAIFPMVSVETMLAEACAADMLLVNPSFSPLGLGLRFPGRSLMYAQGFSTFSVLDAHQDRYVAVSPFVRDFLRNVYGIESRVIPAFIDEPATAPAAWHERPDAVVLHHCKDHSPLGRAVVAAALSRLQAALPDVTFLPLLADGPVPRPRLLERLGEARYLLTLSLAEGFGLIPLEAMARGVVVLGFDGFGGRGYMGAGVNCQTVPYGRLEELVEGAVAVVRSPDLAERLSREAARTAMAFGYGPFEARWTTELGSFLDIEPCTT
jgi:hypothetical protein